jgi:hypothetical protein
LFVGGCTDTLRPSRVWTKQSSRSVVERVHEEVECFSFSRALTCFYNGQTILSEGHGYRCQEGYYDIWSVMEDFSKTVGDKDLIKMKTQYEMFVDTVDSKQVKV